MLNFMEGLMRITSHIFAFLICFVSITAFGLQDTEYSINCKFNGSKYHPVQFRLYGTYVITDTDTGRLESYVGLYFSEPDLYVVEGYKSQKSKDSLESDPKYKPKDEKWENHVRFTLKDASKLGKSASGGDLQLFLSLEPEEVKRVNKDTGRRATHITYSVHAGIEYYVGDPGNRTEITCTAERWVFDQK